MKNIHYFLSIFLLLSSSSVFAKKISSEQSLTVAKKLVNNRSELRSGQDLTLVHTAYDNDYSLRNDEESSVLFYVYNIDDRGFVIIAGDDVTYPVIGYSFNGVFKEDEVRGNFKFFLEMVEEHISKKISDQVKPSQRTVDAWNEFLSDEEPFNPIVEETFGPYITTKWGQAYPFNLKCPKISGEYSLSGCITTVQVQLMNYWEHPITGTGTIGGYMTSISSKLWVPSINLSLQTYDWDKMDDVYNSSSSQEARDEAAKLTYHAAVSIYADFGLIATYSDVTDLPRALMNNFYYDVGIRQYDRSYYPLSDWENIVLSELREGRPMLFRGEDPYGGSHVYICDGNDSRGAYHFNWGWNGRWDGFYSMETFYDVDRMGLPSEYKFLHNMTMMVGIQPDKGNPLASIVFLKERTNLYSDREQVKKNEEFIARAQFRNNGFKSYRGNYYMVLVNAENEVVAQLSSVPQNIVLTSGSSSKEFEFTCVVPPDVVDGDYTIRAATKDSGSSVYCLLDATPGYIDSLPLKVEDSLPLYVEIAGGDQEFRIGEAKRLRAVVFPSDVSNQNVIWTSSDSTIVKIDEKGYIKAESIGTAVISVKMEDYELADSCEISVNSNPPVFSDSEILIFDNSYLRNDDNGSLEILLNIPETDYFSGSFVITLPDSFALNSELTVLTERNEFGSEIQIMPGSENSWLISISRNEEIDEEEVDEDIQDLTRNSDFLKIIDLVYRFDNNAEIIEEPENPEDSEDLEDLEEPKDLEEPEDPGDEDIENPENSDDEEEGEEPDSEYEGYAIISDLVFNFGENSLYKSDVAFLLLLEKKNVSSISSPLIDGKVYLKDDVLYIDSPYSEQIRIYSTTGALLNVIEKPVGQISVGMNRTPHKILLIKGSSGWVKKVTI